MPQPDTNTELREALSKLNGSGAHACYCERSTDGGCKCALSDEYVEEIMQLITSHNKKLELSARIDERKQVALDNYQGQTFSDATDYKAKFDKFIRNNERRIELLTPKPYKSGI